MVEIAEERPHGPLELPTVSGGNGPRFLRETGAASLVGAQAGEKQGVVELDSALDAKPSEDSVFLISGSDLAGGEIPDVVIGRLQSIGIRGLIAPGFERRLYERSFSAGLLPVIVGREGLEQLLQELRAKASVSLTVDLEEQVVQSAGTGPIPFEADPRLRNKLLLGLEDLDEMLRYAQDAEALREADRARRPWLYEDSGDP